MEQREKRKTKTRTGKRMKTQLKQFKIFSQNISGIKAMVHSDLLNEPVDDTNPTIRCINETHLIKEEEIAIPGYETVFREDGTNNSGGIMIAVKDNIKTISMQTQHKKGIGQALRIKIVKK